jgi:hypothetical protein
VVGKNALEAARKAIFVLDAALPMSFVPPPSWGAVRDTLGVSVQRPAHRELAFENDKTIKRATVPVHGRD